MLSICVPAQDTVKTEFAAALSSLRAQLSANRITNHLHIEQGSSLPQQRYNLAQSAIEAGSTHILWLDSDMIFPPDIYDTLAAHNKSIVACTYAQKDTLERSTAFIETENGFIRVVLDDSGLLPVTACGMGVMLTKTSLFEDLPKPWFNFTWHHETEHYNGEDIYFCEEAALYGHTVYIDATASKNIYHVGNHSYTLGHHNV